LLIPQYFWTIFDFKTSSSDLEGVVVPYELFDCVYSPAKKRGPNPGQHNKRKTDVSEAQQQQQQQPVRVSSPSSTSHSASPSPPIAIAIGSTASTASNGGHMHPNGQHNVQHQAPVLPAGVVADHHLAMLAASHPVGNMLRSYYQLTINEMFRLPTTGELSTAGAYSSRFAELALGALVKDDMVLAHELCNVVVHCLQAALRDNFDDDPRGNGNGDDDSSYEVAKTYYLLGVFRAFRGDFGRYFKYRRICLTCLSKLPVRLAQNGSLLLDSVSCH
jgi:hypothetical protein